MKFCFSTLVCPNWSLPEIVGAAAAHGFGGVDLRGIGPEIDVTRLSLFNEELDSTLELLDRYKLQIPCLNTSIAAVTPATERWEAVLEDGRRHAVLAGKLGARFIRVFGGAVPKGVEHGEAVAMARRHLRQLGKICAAQGCQVLVETHDEWSASSTIMELVEGFDPLEVAVLWDVEHPFRKGEPPGETARTLGRYARHVHFKDAVRREGKSLPRLMGEGELPLAEAMAALREIKYDGWICLETEKRWHPREAPEPEESLPQFMRWMGLEGAGEAVRGR